MTTKTKKYIQTKGRRKTATSRTRIVKGEGKILINGEPYESYFHDIYGATNRIKGLLKKAKLEGKVDLSITVKGGGKNAQVEATLHSLARALLQKDRKLKRTLRVEGYLTRDPRMKERKKYGLKRARRAPQWQKR